MFAHLRPGRRQTSHTVSSAIPLDNPRSKLCEASRRETGLDADHGTSTRSDQAASYGIACLEGIVLLASCRCPSDSCKTGLRVSRAAACNVDLAPGTDAADRPEACLHRDRRAWPCADKPTSNTVA